MIRPLTLAFALGSLLALGTAADSAAVRPPQDIAVANSFRIGNSGVLCTAQVNPLDPNLHGMFDRAYAITCRDASAAVGHLYALRSTRAAVVAEMLAAQPEQLSCEAPVSGELEAIGKVAVTHCVAASGVKYTAYAVQRHNTLYVAEGLSGYDSALRLGLRTIFANRAITGAIEVATTAAGDPAAFARVQAGTLNPDTALSMAYLRNNEGSFAEAGEFFETLSERAAEQRSADRNAEYLINEALQQSNLGNFNVAASLFARAGNRTSGTDQVFTRLLRNAHAIDELNQHYPDAALTALNAAVPKITSGSDDELGKGTISPTLAEQINRQNRSLQQLGGVDTRLRPAERAQILDGQAELLRGVALRQLGKDGEALEQLRRAEVQLAAVRDGQVVSTAFLRSQAMAERALIDEAKQDYPAAERDFASSAQIMEQNYPGSAALLAAKARFAAYLTRRGAADRALALYREVVQGCEQLSGAAATLRNLLSPYFDLLAARASTDPGAVTAMFDASQILVRPGLAQTQAVFARELSGGNDEAASLFRQSVALGRDVTRTQGEIARLTASSPRKDSPEAAQLEDARTRLAELQRDQTAVLSHLGDFPRYRALAPTIISLAELQKILRPDEVYYLLRVVGDKVYAMAISPGGARAIKVSMSASELGDDVAKLRKSIATLENGRVVTYPFDVARARKLYVALMEPFGATINAAKSLIYEPDGPMLQLPANLLIMDQAGVDAYAARMADPKADAYDYRGMKWLGRDRNVTTAVSPRSFADVRQIAPSSARHAYIGLGQNAAPSPLEAIMRIPTGDSADGCNWPISAWQNPISAAELHLASSLLAPTDSVLITGADFSDTAIIARKDLDQYRIMHFATHGLVTAPRPRCPARPALLTSFGGPTSDGLLSFREIYDLRLDADLIILSACDTAGTATVEATREAGISTGGNFALDGLVRAFVGAGARTVIASHWPVPDDYDATKRLMTNMFSTPPGTPVAESLRRGQLKLMDSAETSHPFYWAAFAIVGDGEQPIVGRRVP